MGTLAASLVVSPASRPINGRMRVPGDKSISHRYALLAAVADGESIIDHYAPGADCRSTLDCLARLGVVHSIETLPASESDLRVRVQGRGLGGLVAASSPIDAGNSGSTLRMLAGLLAAHPFETTIGGDASLSRRPMRRVIVPLERMGASIRSTDGRPPLSVRGGALQAIDYTPDVASAQVKSAILLAGLHARGRTIIHELVLTRDHTERALRAFGAEIRTSDGEVALEGGQRLQGRALTVPGDLSSAAFWACAAAAIPRSDLTVERVGLNPSRTHIIDVLRRSGATLDVQLEGEDAGEPRGAVRIRSAARQSLTITPEEVPSVIDELPVLAALASHGGEIHVSGAAELRTKESDRISALITGLRAMGAEAEERPDGFSVRGSAPLAGDCAVDAASDHRLAMAFAIAALGARAPVRIDGAEVVDVSYPGFFRVLEALCG
jgi:3-phosphoshikimate 1-carboxyvinyltransferase